MYISVNFLIDEIKNGSLTIVEHAEAIKTIKSRINKGFVCEKWVMNQLKEKFYSVNN